jgi:hypothetical protein
MSNQLSHSASAKFQSCPTEYKFHYIDKLRSKITSSGLLFGSAIDKAMSSLFVPTPDETPEEAFDKIWYSQQINKKDIILPFCPVIAYSNSDLDTELYSQDDLEAMREVFKCSETEVLGYIDKLVSEKEYCGFKDLPDDRKSLLNYANWLCLRQKGLLMIQAVREQILPQVEHVFSVQEKVELKNDVGDSVIGYVDIVVKLKDYELPVYLDFKTSSIDYAKDSVLTSPQLTLYTHCLFPIYKSRRAGFIVIHKRINKNKTKTCSKCGNDGTGKTHRTCDALDLIKAKDVTQSIKSARCNGEWNIKLNPKVYIQTIIDEIPEQTENIVLENYDYINEALNNKVFTRNFGSCIRPWGKCAFFNLCYKNSLDGLEKV